MKPLERIKQQLDELDGRVVVVTKTQSNQEQAKLRQIANAG